MTTYSRRAGLGVAGLLGALLATTQAEAQIRAPELAAPQRAACEQEARLLFPPRSTAQLSRVDGDAQACSPTPGGQACSLGSGRAQPILHRRHDLNWNDRRDAEHRCQVIRSRLVTRD